MTKFNIMVTPSLIKEVETKTSKILNSLKIGKEIEACNTLNKTPSLFKEMGIKWITQ